MTSVNSHIALDLDDTLIHAVFITEKEASKIENSKDYDFLKGRTTILKIVDIRDDNQIGSGNLSNALIIFRPGAKEFVKFCLDNFDKVTFWSAGHKRYVRAVIGTLVDPGHPKYANQKLKVLTRQDCNEVTDTSVLKSLASKGFDMKKTIIVDDNVSSYRLNIENAIPIEGYNPQVKKEHIEYEDKTLYRIIEWFKETNIMNVEDVRTIDKTNIYKK